MPRSPYVILAINGNGEPDEVVGQVEGRSAFINKALKPRSDGRKVWAVSPDTLSKMRKQGDAA